MPEGHSVHRIARQFDRNFVGKTMSASSPQGRFAEGAAVLDGRQAVSVQAVGKQMFLEAEGDLWLRVHLGLYGAWDFAGEILVDPTIASANGRMGQTNQRGTTLDEAILDDAGENSLASIGAPRRARVHVRMSEQTKGLTDEVDEWPPPVVGQVRLRLMTDITVADLRGPTACVLQTPEEMLATVAKLGPDPLVGDPAENEERFVRAVRKKPTPIALLLMDQAVVSGIGNVYRAEMLYRQRLNPHTPGRDVPEDVVRALWHDWVRLLAIGVETGQMMTMDGLSPEQYRAAMASRDDRHWVYHRAGLPCRVCGTEIALEEIGARKLYWCPRCQA
ncbi:MULTISPECIES: Fpg/Nei family DNA glycosylase [Microbacterium]|uniref:Fpg/Nei family DNA glycosylase n=1 Tax=Microbacterium TaxID=33882 RepID=UPI00046A0346|nr:MULTISPECIES: DNA-formamidopyrimidine glycosylase family protein [Microbacterium]AMG84474.1 DNA glycosylase [Microbacterium sp. PAMC 28756]MDH5132842.1 DNA-formamidopyrimidine glycosylase family protein [Microbacterium sp. RD10]MDH5136441.1 DNA-formamidopyrimidine glycosylase family protein [Microbacterium sp. RD11]MDH5145093.1 DNA-formamidopyrimidine glycosylase family protein [Microbacterium sp. RD12]MDH5154830.1 DNA-formamidopyrimidine glycosylase family protein [Microbacterium sp. RD06]